MKFRRLVAIPVLLGALQACGGNGSLRTAKLPPTPLPPARAQTIYVTTSAGTPAVLEFAASANGDAAPINSIAGSNTQITSPLALGIDSKGDLAVLNNAAGGNQVLTFPVGASGNVAPAAILAGSATDFVKPVALTLDALGHVFVADAGSNSLLVFPASSSGNVAPARIISGNATQIARPGGLAADAIGDVAMSSESANSIIEFSPAQTGNVAPIRTISGPATTLEGPGALVYDSKADLYVASGGANQITPAIVEFPELFNLNPPPTAVLSGTTTQLTATSAITVDGAGYLYIAESPLSCANSAILVFAPGAIGDAAPVQTIAGPSTEFGCVTGLVVR